MNISSLPGAAALLPQARTQEQGSHQLNSAAGHSTGSGALVQGSGAVQDQRQAALQIVDRILTSAYEKISNRGQAQVQIKEEYSAFEPLTAEKVANNILGFIERRLQMDVAEGATQEELQARLDAGLSGFKKGFAEASEKLEALSLLSPDIKTDIGKTYDLVTSGIDDLRSKFITAMEPPTAPIKTESSVKNTKAAVELKVPEFLPTAKTPSVSYGNYEYASAREFSFSLTTKEGDKLTIKATASEGLAMEAGHTTNGSLTAGFYNASYSASQSMSWKVEGDLNEEELQAINDLLGRVNDLAGQFFSGNLDAAFEQAVSLGYDDTQIGKFALNLTQVEIQQVTQAYKAFEPRAENALSDNGAPNLFSERLLPLGNFIKDLLDTLDRASVFDQPELLVADVGEKITGNDEVALVQGSRFSQFMKDLFALHLQQTELDV